MFVNKKTYAMINADERQKLKVFLNANYTEEVKEVLQALNVTSRLRKPYSSSMIRRVFNGYVENAEIEKALLTVYTARKEKKEQQTLDKRRLLDLES